ncbi:peptidylprolyl isomerase [Marinobacter lacisalsi]|uniref:Peptidyl-prolyl cis-trans isomerase n=1 Tax=Marinobacter lacisalsi TaxID=475979 RepID=A0ABV8QGR4_9GAMM
MDRLSTRTIATQLIRVLGPLLTALIMLGVVAPAQAQDSSDDNDTLPEVRVSTTEGAFTVRLRPDIAPLTVANFLEYVEEGFYDGTVFHRVIPGFMVQGGGFDKNLNKKTTGDPIVNESRQTAKNLRGTLAMARTRDPDSATAQFFVNLVDNPHLDATASRQGYAVFGTITEGISVIDAIARVQTTRAKGMSDVPVDPVIIESIRLVDDEQ